MRPLTPGTIAPPFARYAHGVELDSATRLILTSGQLGLAADGSVPPDARAQADICFANIAAILAEAGAGSEHVVKITAYVTDRMHMAAYMAARDAWFGPHPPAYTSTLVIVSGFTRPEFLVEVEVTAALPPS
ncbi:RidA family protein [Algicella marina]|uniref:RidA family protein n=1 Tax=Algicella marina TaxID=2683284 RepID=A0A6P1SWL2_9RHOB|nr:RidA family protein [Algicella marina]QHQ33871.1 RidA family protein [Algicella marina]